MNRALARALGTILLAVAVALALIYRDRLDAAALTTWVSGAGAAGPLLFIGIYAAATVLFLPGSVLTLAGGALFGPLWGTLYNLVGATLGAALAFLIARYLAGDWVQARAKGLLARLVQGVEAEGWRFVAFTRLVPLFPFNLLNYALGLTRIPFLSYLLATLVFMLPGAMAYTYLGFAGREAVAGGEGVIQKGLIALALLAAVAFLPRLVARLRRGSMLPVAEPVGEQGHIAGAAKFPPEDLPGRIEALDAELEGPVQQILAPRDATLPTVRSTETGAESRPRISVVVPTLNEAAIIAQTLADLAPLRALGHELILVDGGSRDGTQDLAVPLADRVLEAPRGRACQMDAGARVAGGDWLWFLHADIQVPPPALEALLGACRAPTVWGRFDVRLSGAAPALRMIERMMNARSRLTGIATGDQGVFVARAAYDAVGGFPQIPLMEDIALSRLLRRRQRPLCLRTPLIVSSRRWEQRGIGRTVLLMWRLRLAYALGADPRRLAEDYGR